jgi:hypothetical protein
VDTDRKLLTLKLAGYGTTDAFSPEAVMPRLSRLAVFIVGAALGLALWVVPALLSDEPLPWDRQGIFAVALLLIGLMLGFFGPGQPVAAVAGVLVGQLLVLLGRVLTNASTSDLWLVSAMLLAGYTCVAGGIGAVLGNALRRRLGPVPRERDRRGG